MKLTVHTQLGPYDFDGPHNSVDSLSDSSGVYVLTTINNGLHKVLDVGESAGIKSRVTRHDRNLEWQKHVIDRLYVSALYCDEPSRMQIEKQIRSYHNPPCGVR